MQHIEEGLTTQAMYVQCNTEARSCTHCCSGKAISITYYETVLINLHIQHAMRMRHSVFCGLSGFAVFFHIISQAARFSGKMLLNIKCVFRICLQISSHTFLILRSTERDVKNVYIALHVKYPLFSSDFNEFSRQIFRNGIKFKIV